MTALGDGGRVRRRLRIMAFDAQRRESTVRNSGDQPFKDSPPWGLCGIGYPHRTWTRRGVQYFVGDSQTWKTRRNGPDVLRLRKR